MFGHIKNNCRKKNRIRKERRRKDMAKGQMQQQKDMPPTPNGTNEEGFIRVVAED